MTDHQKNTLDATDRAAILDTLARYCWCLDRGDAAGAAVLFTADGLLQNSLGQVFNGPEGVEAFLAAVVSKPGYRGRQYHVRNLFIHADATGWHTLSYYQAVTSLVGKEPEILSVGYYDDQFVKVDGQWRFKTRYIRRWNSEVAPLAGDVTLAPAPEITIDKKGQFSAEDREEIADLLTTYASCLDRGDAPGMAAIFEPDGSIHSATLGDHRGAGGIRDFVAKAASQPGFKGRQHRIRPVAFEAERDRCRVTAYWMTVTWQAGKEPHLVALGYYEAMFERKSGAWKFKDLTTHPWDNESAPTLPGIS